MNRVVLFSHIFLVGYLLFLVGIAIYPIVRSWRVRRKAEKEPSLGETIAEQGARELRQYRHIKATLGDGSIFLFGMIGFFIFFNLIIIIPGVLLGLLAAGVRWVISLFG